MLRKEIYRCHKTFNIMLKNVIKKLITFIMCKIHGISCGQNCYIGYNLKHVNNSKSKGVKLGNNVIIRPGCKMYTNSSNGICIESYTEIGEYSTISCNNKIIIEEGVLTGPHVFISDHNHNYENPKLPIYAQGISNAPNSKIIIGNGSWLGTNSVIVGNIHIGKHCVIGANSVVTKNIPDYCVAAGVPARIIKKYNFTTETWEKIL